MSSYDLGESEKHEIAVRRRITGILVSPYLNSRYIVLDTTVHICSLPILVEIIPSRGLSHKPRRPSSGVSDPRWSAERTPASRLVSTRDTAISIDESQTTTLRALQRHTGGDEVLCCLVVRGKVS